MTQPTGRLVCSVAEAAEMLDVAEELVRQWLDRGVLPEVLPKASRRRLIPLSAIQAVIDHAMSDWSPAEAVARLRDEAA